VIDQLKQGEVVPAQSRDKALQYVEQSMTGCLACCGT